MICFSDAKILFLTVDCKEQRKKNQLRCFAEAYG